MDLSDLPPLLTVPETARFTRKGKNTIYDMVKAGEIPHVKLGRSIRIPRSWLEALVAGEVAA